MCFDISNNLDPSLEEVASVSLLLLKHFFFPGFEDELIHCADFQPSRVVLALAPLVASARDVLSELFSMLSDASHGAHGSHGTFVGNELEKLALTFRCLGDFCELIILTARFSVLEGLGSQLEHYVLHFRYILFFERNHHTVRHLCKFRVGLEALKKQVFDVQIRNHAFYHASGEQSRGVFRM